jgi:hypothetical protein
MKSNIKELAASLQQVESNFGLDVSSRQAVVRAADLFIVSRFELGKSLAHYKQDLGHGAWMAASAVIAKGLDLSDRTIRDIMLAYRNTLPLANDVIEELVNSGVDPVSHHGQKVVSILRGRDTANLYSPVEQVELAIAEAFPKKPSMPIGIESLTAEERIIWKVRVAVRSSLSNVAPNRKLQVLIAAIEEEVHALLGPHAAFTVTPREPVLDLMGLKRSKEVA